MLATDQPVPCQSNPDMWLGGKKIAAAKAVCFNVCQMREACLQNALDLEAQLGTTLIGVHGGTTPSERRNLAA